MKLPLFIVLVCAPALALAQEPVAPPETVEQVIQPDIERRPIKIPRIAAQDIEVGLFTGTLSVEDFGSSGVRGIRLAYHVTEDVFMEATYALSTVSDTSFRRLGFVPVFRNEEEELTYYNISFGLNLFPGEVFAGRTRAMTSAVYLAAGIGNTNFNNTDHTTFNFGIGIRVLPVDWFALRVEMRDHMFESDLLGQNKITHNFELTAGAAVYF